MFEPLKDLIAPHADDFKQYLSRIEGHLASMVNDVESQVEFDQFTTRNGRANAAADGTATIELSPNEGFSWDIRRVGLTSSKEKGNCAVYVGSVAPENLVDVFREPRIAADRGRYFVPRGQKLIFHFYEQDVGQTCTVNIQAEQLIPVVKARRVVSGMASEAYDHPREPPIPSGEPLSERQIAGS